MSDRSKGPVSRHPVIDAYLDDLGRALAGVEESERIEVLASVREHIDAALGDDEPTAAEVRTVLENLGPVERIAAAAEPGPTAPVPPVVPVPPVPPVVPVVPGGVVPGWSTWAGPVLIALAGLSLALVPVNLFVGMPLAVVVGVVAVAGMRRHRGVAGLFVAAGVVSALTLVLGVAVALTLLSAGADAPTSEPAVEVSPPEGTGS